MTSGRNPANSVFLIKVMDPLAVVCLLTLLPVCLTADAPSVTLMNAAKPGTKMPVTGIGTGGYNRRPGSGPGEVWNDTVSEKAIKEWLAVGGRRIDGAIEYGDQLGVGNAVKASGVPRKEIFMTSKVSFIGYNETFTQMNDILSDLQMDYVDLLLIHWPGNPPNNTTDPACQGNPSTWRSCRQSIWKALVEIFKNGTALAIGVSNFEKNHLEDILMMKSMVPSVNQVEYHPYWHEDELVEYCKQNNILFNGYAPLGRPDGAPIIRGWNRTILDLPVIQSIANTHQHSAAQILQRWQWQQGIVVNPRSMNQDHMKENLNFFDFELSEDEMKQISSIKPPSDPKVCPDPRSIK